MSLAISTYKKVKEEIDELIEYKGKNSYFTKEDFKLSVEKYLDKLRNDKTLNFTKIEFDYDFLTINITYKPIKAPQRVYLNFIADYKVAANDE